jgi:hypothetical protein
MTGWSQLTNAAACTNHRFLKAAKHVTKSKMVLPRVGGTRFSNVSGGLGVWKKTTIFGVIIFAWKSG